MWANHISRILTVPGGKTMLSILVGFGLATIFRKSCEGRSCTVHVPRPVTEIVGKIFQWDNNCVQYRAVDTACTPDAVVTP